MLEYQRDLSSQSSMSSDSCPSFSRLSFDCVELPSNRSTSSPENLLLKPHRSSDSSWPAAFSAPTKLGFRDFSLVKQIGSGDIGKVYLCKLRTNESCFFAMKVVDKEVLALKKKIQRSETERKIMKMVDHPFLPTLYAEFEASHFSCVVMEYCSGGDLHSLRHKQPHNRFSLSSARFYAAEVLVAMEYLHMLGIIYRDLKPENVLVRSDGHIMLTDFDLSLCSDSITAVQSPDESQLSAPPAASFTCLPTRIFRSKKIQTTSSERMFVAEPVTAKSTSFVGTHEYVAPEVAGGLSHGNAVDWWAYGIFLYEMIYGRTPFAGATNVDTLRNIVKTPLTFPVCPVSASEMQARDLITGLLNKDPERRLGSKRGAGEIKTHPFFKSLNFALIRGMTPPGMTISTSKTTASSLKPVKHQKIRFDYF